MTARDKRGPTCSLVTLMSLLSDGARARDDASKPLDYPVRRKEQERSRDITRVAKAGKRNALDDVVAHRARKLISGDIGLNQARRDGVDPNSIRTKLSGHRLRETQDAGLGGRIMRAAKDSAASLRGYGRRARDRTAFVRAHVRNECLTEIHRAAKTNVEDEVIVLRLDLHDLERLRDASVVD